MVPSIMSSNQGFEMFSNNNYLPDIGQFSNNTLTSQQPTVNQGIQFTFAVPTQASTYNFTLGPMHQPRGIYSNPISNYGIGPGLGTPWQHSIPNPMPWGEDTVPQSCPAVSTFSAIPPISSSFSIYNNVPSCSTTPRRPKRHSSTDIEKEAPGSKCRVTAEKMAARMEGLSLSSAGSQTGCNSTGYQFDQSPTEFDFEDLPTDPPCSYMREDWRKFKEIENRLNSECEDEEFCDLETGVKVHISKYIAKNVMESPPLLPEKLLNSLNKPCMELVLWKSPGGFDKDNIKWTDEPSTTDSQTLPPCVQSTSINHTTITKDMVNDTTCVYSIDSYDEDDMDL